MIECVTVYQIGSNRFLWNLSSNVASFTPIPNSSDLLMNCDVLLQHLQHT